MEEPEGYVAPEGRIGYGTSRRVLRRGAARKDMERGVKWSHGERGIHSNGEGSSDLRVAAGLWVDNHVAIRDRLLANLAKSVDAKYNVTGLG